MKLTGSGEIASADYKAIRWVGKTKGGKAVKITMPVAICITDPNFEFLEKNETVLELEFEGCYEDEKLAAGDFTEPWELEIDDAVEAGNGEVILGVGKVSIGSSLEDLADIGLTRGGGSFRVTRELREINADDDPGKVKDRLRYTGARPILKINLLQWLSKTADIYPGLKTVGQ